MVLETIKFEITRESVSRYGYHITCDHIEGGQGAFNTEPEAITAGLERLKELLNV